jgi:hypothetical protein
MCVHSCACGETFAAKCSQRLLVDSSALNRHSVMASPRVLCALPCVLQARHGAPPEVSGWLLRFLLSDAAFRKALLPHVSADAAAPSRLVLAQLAVTLAEPAALSLIWR